MKKLLIPIAILLFFVCGLSLNGAAQSFDLPAFSAIGIENNADVILYRGDKQEVRVEGDQELIDKLDLEVKNQSLKIKNKREKGNRWGSSNYKNRLTFYITIPEIHSIGISGSGDLTMKDAFTSEEMNIGISGSGDIVLVGSSETLNIGISGSGDIDGAKWMSENCDIGISGSGDVEVGAEEQLNVAISGSGDVVYHGNPETSMSVMGSGEVKRKK